MVNCKNVAAGQAESYYRADDYYTKGAPAAGWHGRGAVVLGLSEAHASQQFADLLRGRLPEGTEIAAGAGGKRRAGTDLTISAPKSISIAALVNGDERLLDAHREAVCAALAEVENRVHARVTRHGQAEAITTGNMVCRAVEHDTSRLGDPNLHTHCVILNVTQRPDGAWVAIENREIFRAQRELDLVYKSELAARAAGLGYTLRATRDGFELANVSDAQIREFSRRKGEVDQALAERGLTREQATAEQREMAALSTRDRKQAFDRAQLREDWRARGAAVLVDPCIPHAPLDGLAFPDAAQDAVTFARDHLAEREMAFSETALQRAALQASWGSARLAEIKGEIAKREASGEFIRKADGTLTTEKGQRLEREILGVEVRGRGAVAALADGLVVRRNLESSCLNDKQRAAVELLMTSRNRVIGVQGKAGVGKTTLLNEYRLQAEAAGFRVAGVAPSHSAVKALGEAGIEAQTLQGWEVGKKCLDSKTIVLVDESSLASARQLANVLKSAETAQARVVLVGDSGQYQSVDAGKAFEQLQANGLQTATVDKMLRQQTEELRAVAQLAAEGKGREALSKLGEGVHEIADRDARHYAIAQRFVALDADARRDCLVLTGSNEDRKALNTRIRQALGVAGKGAHVATFQRSDMTAAEKKRAASYQVGQSIRFERDYTSLGAARGEVVSVIRIDGNHIVAACQDGREMRISPAQLAAKGISVGKTESRELAAGDRIRVTGNIPTLEGTTLRNGQRADVLSVDNGRMQLKVDGLRKPVEIEIERRPLSLDHGYAATGHSAQGLGARRVFLERDSRSMTASEREFYTDVTRVKEKLEVFTDNVEKLADAIGRVHDKTIALERGGLEFSIGG